MAALEVIALDVSVPQLRTPGADDTYIFPRPVTFGAGHLPRIFSADTTISPLMWNSNNFDIYEITAMSNNITLPTDAGTPLNGQKLLFRFRDNGVPRTLNWANGTPKSFREIGVILPTLTSSNKTVYVGCIYNAAEERWDALAVGQEL